MTEILAAGLSPKDTMTRITHEVRRKRFPHLSAMEKDFGGDGHAKFPLAPAGAWRSRISSKATPWS